MQTKVNEASVGGLVMLIVCVMLTLLGKHYLCGEVQRSNLVMLE